MSLGQRASVLIGLLVLLQAGSGDRAHAQASLEYSVKANYLVRFAAFAEWPPVAFAAADAPLVICVAGDDPFGGLLDRAAAGQTAHGRSVTVRRPAASALTGCHIAYLGKGGVMPVRAPAGVLIVTDDAVSAQRGAIHFVIAQSRVRFHIDQRRARAGQVTLSSRLLNLALSVQGV